MSTFQEIGSPQFLLILFWRESERNFSYPLLSWVSVYKMCMKVLVFSVVLVLPFMYVPHDLQPTLLFSSRVVLLLLLLWESSFLKEWCSHSPMVSPSLRSTCSEFTVMFWSPVFSSRQQRREQQHHFSFCENVFQHTSCSVHQQYNSFPVMSNREVEDYCCLYVCLLVFVVPLFMWSEEEPHAGKKVARKSEGKEKRCCRRRRWIDMRFLFLVSQNGWLALLSRRRTRSERQSLFKLMWRGDDSSGENQRQVNSKMTESQTQRALLRHLPTISYSCNTNLTKVDWNKWSLDEAEGPTWLEGKRQTNDEVTWHHEGAIWRIFSLTHSLWHTGQSYQNLWKSSRLWLWWFCL